MKKAFPENNFELGFSVQKQKYGREIYNFLDFFLNRIILLRSLKIIIEYHQKTYVEANYHIHVTNIV